MNSVKIIMKINSFNQVSALDLLCGPLGWMGLLFRNFYKTFTTFSACVHQIVKSQITENSTKLLKYDRGDLRLRLLDLVGFGGVGPGLGLAALFGRPLFVRGLVILGRQVARFQFLRFELRDGQLDIVLFILLRFFHLVLEDDLRSVVFRLR